MKLQLALVAYANALPRLPVWRHVDLRSASSPHYSGDRAQGIGPCGAWKNLGDQRGTLVVDRAPQEPVLEQSRLHFPPSWARSKQLQIR